MTPVEAYFQRTKSNPNNLAALLGCAPSTVYRMLRGERTAGTKFAKKVEQATNGEITASDFLKSCLEANQPEAAQ